MDYIYTELDPTNIDLSKCLIFHNFRELPDPQEKLYKRVAFVTSSDNLDLMNDKMYICLLIEGRYTWVEALAPGVDAAVIEGLREYIATKADDQEVRDSFGEVINLIQDVNNGLIKQINTKADEDLVNQNFASVRELIDDLKEDDKPLIVNVNHISGGLEMDKTWQEIWDAYQAGKVVMCRYWPEWLTDATYYPPRALYPMVGIGVISPNEYVCYTGDGTFLADTPESLPRVDTYSEQDGELVPVQLTYSGDDTNLKVGEAMTITAFADFGGDYSIDWEVLPLEGELTDFHYIKEDKTLTITPKLYVEDYDYEPKIKITAVMRGIPSICVPLFITAKPERFV